MLLVVEIRILTLEKAHLLMSLCSIIKFKTLLHIYDKAKTADILSSCIVLIADSHMF